MATNYKQGVMMTWMTREEFETRHESVMRALLARGLSFKVLCDGKGQPALADERWCITLGDVHKLDILLQDILTQDGPKDVTITLLNEVLDREDTDYDWFSSFLPIILSVLRENR